MSSDPAVHINWVRGVYARRILDCPVCKRRRRMVQFIDFSPYYGGTLTCLGCGDGWQDGEMLERPFRPRWRLESRDHARKAWAAGSRLADALAIARPHWGVSGG